MIDQARQSIHLEVEDGDGLRLPLSQLSDGTLRFLAFVILAMDESERGVLCIEEPENVRRFLEQRVT